MTWSVVGSFIVGFAVGLIAAGVLYYQFKVKKANG